MKNKKEVLTTLIAELEANNKSPEIIASLKAELRRLLTDAIED